MIQKKKTLIAGLLTVSLLAFATPTLAHDKHNKAPSHGHHGGGSSYNNKPNYGWNDSKRDYNDRNDHHGGGNYGYNNRYNFDMHVPSYLKHTHSRLPVLIVLDGNGKYRGQSAKRFFQKKAAREGFILAYAYNNRHYGHKLSSWEKDAIIRDVLRNLDGRYRVNTNRINVYLNF